MKKGFRSKIGGGRSSSKERAKLSIMQPGEIKLPSLQITPKRDQLKRFTFKEERNFSQERQDEPTLVLAELNESITAGDRAYYPEPFTNTALFMNGNNRVMRYDLV